MRRQLLSLSGDYVKVVKVCQDFLGRAHFQRQLLAFRSLNFPPNRIAVKLFIKLVQRWPQIEQMEKIRLCTCGRLAKRQAWRANVDVLDFSDAQPLTRGSQQFIQLIDAVDERFAMIGERKGD